MFCIVMPVAFIPLLGVLYWGDWKAKRIGALSIASSAYARRQALEQADHARRPWPRLLLHFLNLIDAVGLVLFSTALSLILLPFTLVDNADGRWHNPSMIAMETVGWVVLLGFAAYEWAVAEFPLIPRRILNRVFLCCAAVDIFYEIGGYIQLAYYSSWCVPTPDPARAMVLALHSRADADIAGTTCGNLGTRGARRTTLPSQTRSVSPCARSPFQPA